MPKKDKVFLKLKIVNDMRDALDLCLEENLFFSDYLCITLHNLVLGQFLKIIMTYNNKNYETIS